MVMRATTRSASDTRIVPDRGWLLRVIPISCVDPKTASATRLSLQPARRRSSVRTLASHTMGMTNAETSNAAVIRPAGVARAVALIKKDLPRRGSTVAFISGGGALRLPDPTQHHAGPYRASGCDPSRLG